MKDHLKYATRFTRQVVTLEGRLKKCRNAIYVGLHTNFSQYSPEASALIKAADKIYYPTVFYADLFDVMGKKIFPSYHTYKFAQDKIKQSSLFNLLKIPHPKTKVFYGKRQKETICDVFDFPFIAKAPRGSAMGRGVYLIKNKQDLYSYLENNKIAYVQEYLPCDRDIRVVIIGKHFVHAYSRKAPKGEFRCNLAVGGTVCLDPVPREAIELALYTARLCQWNDVGLDIILHAGRYYVLEANMKYGKAGFRAAGIDYIRLMETLIEKRQI
jgi:ribosomal protein S6--L-glutamate ligase